ncbi:MAG TPA: histone deacetylase, partial [bacterium]
LYYSHKCLGYKRLRHPESPDRIASARDRLAADGWNFIEPTPCEKQDILRVHVPFLYESVQNGTFTDPDTPVLPGILEHALLSAGAAAQACESAVQGIPAFSLMRPPGHHATPNRVMGFCYFNNIAVAVSGFMKRNPGASVAIVDIDCHHGNGTEDIFLGNPYVLFVSLHQNPCYPGTGLQSRENCYNIPLPPGTGESVYLSSLERAVDTIRAFNPTLVGVSAGFDTHKDDPITQFGLETATYRKIAEILAALQKPTFAVLEGGYGQRLPDCILEFLRGLSET